MAKYRSAKNELVPVQGPFAQTKTLDRLETPDGWVPPGGYDTCSKWALDNRAALENYARRIEDEGTAAEQLQRFLAEHPEAVTGDSSFDGYSRL